MIASPSTCGLTRSSSRGTSVPVSPTVSAIGPTTARATVTAGGRGSTIGGGAADAGADQDTAQDAARTSSNAAGRRNRRSNCCSTGRNRATVKSGSSARCIASPSPSAMINWHAVWQSSSGSTVPLACPRCSARNHGRLRLVYVATEGVADLRVADRFGHGLRRQRRLWPGDAILQRVHADAGQRFYRVLGHGHPVEERCVLHPLCLGDRGDDADFAREIAV